MRHIGCIDVDRAKHALYKGYIGVDMGYVRLYTVSNSGLNLQPPTPS